MKKWDFHILGHRCFLCNGGIKNENLIFSWKYIVWPIKWLEILPGIWNWNQNFKIDGSLRSMYKYIRKWTYFSDFCENFQGKFFFKGQYQFFTINYTYLYKSLLLRIFLNPYLIKAHCDVVNSSVLCFFLQIKSV